MHPISISSPKVCYSEINLMFDLMQLKWKIALNHEIFKQISKL